MEKPHNKRSTVEQRLARFRQHYNKGVPQECLGCQSFQHEVEVGLQDRAVFDEAIAQKKRKNYLAEFIRQWRTRRTICQVGHCAVDQYYADKNNTRATTPIN